MIVFSAMRDLADGLTRGLGLFLTERQDTTARGINPTPVKRAPRAARFTSPTVGRRDAIRPPQCHVPSPLWPGLEGIVVCRGADGDRSIFRKSPGTSSSRRR